MPFVSDGRGPALSASLAGECNRVLRWELPEGAERVHADLVRKPEEREFDACKQFQV